MTKSTFEMGLCDDCNGFIQERHISEIIQGKLIIIDEMYCMECNKTWKESEWQKLKEESMEKEYHFNSDIENLNRLNNL